MRRTLQLAAIGTAAGVFCGVFGVGGGNIIVPLFILWLGYDAREATGTSLAAIAVIAVIAAGVHGLYGNVRLGEALAIGTPAVAGVLTGTWLQQRIPLRAVRLMFAAFLLVVAATLLF